MSFKKRFLALSAAALLLLGMSVPAGASSEEEEPAAPKRGVTINVYNWGEYISNGVEGTLDVNAEFTRRTGIDVNYTTFDTNESLYSKLAGGGANYDVIIPSDYMVSKLIEEGYLEKLDFDNIPNFQYISDRFKNPSYDPENLYSVPYTWGTLGIIYNSAMVEEPITSWDAMFDPQYADQVLMINNSRDALGIALMDLNYSVNTDSEEELRAAYDLLAQAKEAGVYQAFVMDEVFDKMETGEAAISAYYAGDYLTMLETNPDLKYVVPEEGSNWFVDAMCVLKTSQHKEEAEAWINFMASTEANLRNMDYIWYASPNAEALETYPAYYEETYGEPLDPALYEIMAPSQEVLDRCEAYLVLPAETRTLYNDLWTQLGI